MADISVKDITSYSELLPTQYVNSVKLRNFLQIFLDQVQELEEANVELDRVSTDIDIAYGYQLDIIGKLVGVDRQGLSDAEYRDAIYFQISLNVGSGTPEDCIQYLSSVTRATKVGYWEHYPASIILETNGTSIPSNIPDTLDNITLAGVSVGGVITSETGEVFRGCNIDVAFENFFPAFAPFPEIELGGMDQECGNPLAECSPSDYAGFDPVPDTDNLARCIFPDFQDVYTSFINGAGEDLMQCGEVLAECADVFSNPLTTKGIMANILTKQ